jgi:hypothetical protein
MGEMQRQHARLWLRGSNFSFRSGTSPSSARHGERILFARGCFILELQHVELELIRRCLMELWPRIKVRRLACFAWKYATIHYEIRCT